MKVLVRRSLFHLKDVYAQNKAISENIDHLQVKLLQLKQNQFIIFRFQN